MGLRLLEDRIAVTPDEDKETNEVGLILPDSGQDPYVWGTVVMVGVGRRSEKGDLIPMDVAVGDRVFFHRHSGAPTKIDGEEYKVLRPGDVVAVNDDVH